MILKTIDTIIVKVIALPIHFLASSSFFSPNLSERLALAPFPINPLIALAIITSGKITLVAAFPSVPTPLPIKI